MKLSLCQVYINRVEVIEVNDLRTLGGVIHSVNGTFSPTLNRCDKLTADHQLASSFSLFVCRLYLTCLNSFVHLVIRGFYDHRTACTVHDDRPLQFLRLICCFLTIHLSLIGSA